MSKPYCEKPEVKHQVCSADPPRNPFDCAVQCAMRSNGLRAARWKLNEDIFKGFQYIKIWFNPAGREERK